MLLGTMNVMIKDNGGVDFEIYLLDSGEIYISELGLTKKNISNLYNKFELYNLIDKLYIFDEYYEITEYWFEPTKEGLKYIIKQSV